MVLEVPFDLSPVGIHKSLEVTQASMEEHLKLVPRDRDRGVGIMSPLVLLLAEADLIPEKRRGKGNLGRLCGSCGSKIVLTLLTKVVTVHVRLSAVYVQGIGLNFSWGTSEMTRAGAKAGAGAWASKTALKILCKSSLEYLGTLLATTGGFAPEGPASSLDNLSPDLGGGKESREATKRETEGAMEGRSQRRGLRPWIEVILELIFF